MDALRKAGTLLLATAAGTVSAQTAEFVPMGSAPGGRPSVFSQAWAITRDGGLVTGKTSAEVSGEESSFGFRLDAESGQTSLIEDLVSVDIFSASGDGGVIVGQAFVEDPRDPGNSNLTGVRYTEADGMELILSPRLDTFSTAADVSADGSAIVGMVNFERDFETGFEFSEAYVRTEGEGIRVFADLPNGVGRHEAFDVDGDGSHAVGFAMNFGFERVGVVWETDELSPASIPGLPGSLGSQVATAISDNGRFVAGFSLMEFDGGFQFREDAFLYDRQSDELISLGQTPDGFFSAIPAAISDDGSVVVGTFDETGFFDFPEGAAFVWTPDDGLRTLAEVLETDHGLPVPDWELLSAKDMSADTSRIVGHARETGGARSVQGYLVTLGTTSPCPADLTGPGGDGVPDGSLTADDFFFYLGLFADGDPAADLTGPGGDGVPDGSLTADDFFFYLGLFAEGCP